MRAFDQRRTANLQRHEQRVEQYEQMIAQLREALGGLAERELPGDVLPCFCVNYGRGVHDAWCVDARAALAETADVGRTVAEGAPAGVISAV